MEVISNILEILKIPRKPTHIMYLDKGRSNYPQIQRILGRLLEKNFVSKNQREYVITERGMIFQTMIKEYLNE